ncbi:retinoblastoma-like protein 1 isoform X1 [Thrips palmi]|uniref:Retinoblastoma-like protein 1 isoform X1 n=1 Tax=Thrips palmi TaxID=161013 RepID=A0A6P8YSS1_THRPL|nr:retinoblastoma-like protein 1 isoform X1 [Thrips palmi]
MGVSPGDPDENVYDRHQELCVKLNMDKDTADEAWQNYERIKENYVLEGDQIHWLACALYVSCRKSSTPTVGKPGESVEGNCVSLTRLLRLSKLRLIHFFNKCKKWADMASLPADFRGKIDSLERNFAVSREIFKKFQPIFKDLFQETASEHSQLPKSRKQKNQPCTPSRVFELTWTLFVCIKVDYPDVRDDLVNSYHMLLACCDLIFANALLADRRDLLNPVFPGLPRDFSSPDYEIPKEAPCIIDKLCENHDGIPLEAKGIKAYCWKSHIKKLFEQRVLKGNAETYSGLLDVNNFEANLKAINKQYEEHVLNVGDFDERIFLAEIKRLRAWLKRSQGFTTPSRSVLRALNVEGDADQDIGTSSHAVGDLSEKMQAKRLRQTPNMTVGNQLLVSTPLTNRRYLRGFDGGSEVTPLLTATQSVNRLQSILAGRSAAPSETLLEIFQSCSRNPKEKVLGFVSAIGQKFCERYSASDQDKTTSQDSMNFEKKRLQLGETLYYKILENILTDERRLKPQIDFSNLLEQEVFHQTLLACCIEIVIFSYNAPRRTFPWILEALNVEPFYFYKVIEPIVRAEDQLSRDMIKHLNLIEEQILGSMAWRSESALWENIAASGESVPSCEDVSLPSQLTFDGDGGQQPAANPIVKRLSGAGEKGAASPISSVSAVERFHSPVNQGLPKKRLFEGDHAIKPGQSLLQSKVGGIQITTIKGENGQQYIPIHIQGTNSVIISAQPSTSANSVVKKVVISTESNSEKKDEDKPKRTGSISLFFRKFYHLGSVRMQDLCTRLNLNDSELKRKIWTCFQNTITDHIDLMRDRHIDQLLMCAVYVICKVTKNDRSFTDVMKCYRMQPQASSHVYRSVLLKKADEETDDSSVVAAPLPKELATPTVAAGTSNNFMGEERGDLIKFYNTVYVMEMKAFAQKFSDSQSDSLPLSPLPVSKSQSIVPRRRLTDKAPVFISQLNPQDVTVSPSKLLDYKFSRSPARDLRAINNMIQVDGSRKVCKRLLADDTSEDAPTAKVPANDAVARKLHSIIGDRMGQA